MIEHSEAPYASPLVLVKKPDETYRVCVNFKELNKITVFDPEPMMLGYSNGGKIERRYHIRYVTWLNEILCDSKVSPLPMHPIALHTYL